MNTEAYGLITTILLWGALVALIGAGGFLVAVASNWRSAKRNRRVIWCAGLVAAAFAMVGSQQIMLYKVWLPSVGRQRQREIEAVREASSLTSVGDLAPTFSLVCDDGSSFSLTEHRGNVVLVNFFATWCGPCIAELPHIEAIWDDLRQHDDFAAIVIGREETSESLASFKSEYGLSLPMAADEGRSV